MHGSQEFFFQRRLRLREIKRYPICLHQSDFDSSTDGRVGPFDLLRSNTALGNNAASGHHRRGSAYTKCHPGTRCHSDGCVYLKSAADRKKSIWPVLFPPGRAAFTPRDPAAWANRTSAIHSERDKRSWFLTQDEEFGKAWCSTRRTACPMPRCTCIANLDSAGYICIDVDLPTCRCSGWPLVKPFPGRCTSYTVKTCCECQNLEQMISEILQLSGW